MQLKATGLLVVVAPFRGQLSSVWFNSTNIWKLFKDQLQSVATGLVTVYIKYNTYTNTYMYTNHNYLNVFTWRWGGLGQNLVVLIYPVAMHRPCGCVCARKNKCGTTCQLAPMTANNNYYNQQQHPQSTTPLPPPFYILNIHTAYLRNPMLEEDDGDDAQCRHQPGFVPAQWYRLNQFNPIKFDFCDFSIIYLCRHYLQLQWF